MLRVVPLSGPACIMCTRLNSNNQNTGVILEQDIYKVTRLRELWASPQTPVGEVLSRFINI